MNATDLMQMHVGIDTVSARTPARAGWPGRLVALDRHHFLRGRPGLETVKGSLATGTRSVRPCGDFCSDLSMPAAGKPNGVAADALDAGEVHTSRSGCKSSMEGRVDLELEQLRPTETPEESTSVTVNTSNTLNSHSRM